MSEPSDRSGRAQQAEGGESSRVEMALLLFVVLAFLFVASAAGVALFLL